MNRVDIEAELHAHDLRLTGPRQAVWDVLRGSDRHLSAAEIAALVSTRDARVNVSSVYRTLTLFGELGIVRESHLGEGMASQWELTHDDEVIHIVCDFCGAVQHHAAEPVADLRSHLVRAGFQPVEIDVRVTGRCRNCAA